MFRKKQVLLSITIASLVMVLVIGVTATLPAYSQNAKSGMSIAGITIHCNLKDIDVVNGARSLVTFVTAEEELYLGLTCSNDNPHNRNTAMLTRLLPADEVIRIDTTIELLNKGITMYTCEDSSIKVPGKHITTKCKLPDNNKNFVLLTVNLAK